MKKEYIPVEGNPSLVRDTKSGAIINIDKNEIQKARLRKESRKKKEEELEELKNQVVQINDDLSEIKELLNRLVQK